MQLTIFSIYDSKAEAYIQPFFAPNAPTGLRMFGDAANDETTMFAKHGEDYTLFELGTFDQNTGETTIHKAHKSHGTALQHQRPEGPPHPQLLKEASA